MTDKTNLPQKQGALSLAEVIEDQFEVVDLEAEEDFTISRTLSMDLATEILSAPESVSLDQITGEPFWLDSVNFFAKTTMKNAEHPYYVYLNCHWDDGRGFQGTTGSPFLMSRAVRLAQVQALPRRVMSVLVESRRNAGQASLWIVDAPERHHKENGSVIETTAEAQIS